MLLNINKKSTMHLILGDIQMYLKNYVSDPVKQMECKTIISELAYNIQKYAPKGSVKLTIDNNKTLFITAQDNGEGISNLNDAIKDGYSTSNTLGLGLATIFRLSDEIDVQTSQQGTIISITKRLS